MRTVRYQSECLEPSHHFLNDGGKPLECRPQVSPDSYRLELIAPEGNGSTEVSLKIFEKLFKISVRILHKNTLSPLQKNRGVAGGKRVECCGLSGWQESKGGQSWRLNEYLK